MHVLAPHMSCVVGPNEFADAINQGYKEIYIITSKCIIKHHQLRGNNRFVRLKVDSIPGYQEVEIKEALNFLPAGKIPYAIYEQVLGFFRKVMEVQKSDVEAMIHVLYNAEQGYHLGVPPQTVSKGSVSYDWGYIPSGSSIIVDIHSHNTMNAFFSGTDNNDDRKNISFSGVFGQLKNKEPQTVWRFNYYDQKFDATAEHLFELPVLPEVAIPQEWMDQIKVPTYSVTTYGGGNRGQGNVSAPAGTGRTWDHLKAYQFPRGSVNASSNSPSTPAANQPSGHNDHHYLGSDFNGGGIGPSEDAGIQATFFGHGLDGEQEMEEYYASLGIQPIDAPVPQPRPGAVWRFDPKAGVNKLDENRGDHTFANVIEDAAVSDHVPPEDGAGGANVIIVPQFTKGRQPAAEDNSLLGKPQVETINSTSALQSLAPGFNDERYEAIQYTHGTDVADAWFAIDVEMSMLDGKDDILTELMTDMFNLVSEEGQSKIIRAFFENLSPRAQEHIQQNGM